MNFTQYVVAVALCIAASGGTKMDTSQDAISLATDAHAHAAQRIKALLGEGAQLYPLGSADFTARMLLVLARFNEKVAWAERLASENLKVLVVNRGKPLKSTGRYVKVVDESENKGQEAGVYFRVIDALKRASPNDLPTYVVFAQANPTDYSSMNVVEDTVYRLEAHSQGTEPNGEAKNRRWLEIMEDLETHGFAYLSPNTFNASMFDEWPECIEKMTPVFSSMMSTRHRRCDLSDQRFGPGGNFVVNASLIARQPKDWLTAWDQLVVKDWVPQKMEGHLVERIWACIWNPGYGKCNCTKPGWDTQQAHAIAAQPRPQQAHAAPRIEASFGEHSQLSQLGSADFKGRLLLVLARFNENVAWAGRLASKDVKVIVINRGKPLEATGRYMKEVFDSENRGKEAAFFQVIDALKRAPPNDVPLYVVFAQANENDYGSIMDTLYRLEAHSQGREPSGKLENPRWPDVMKDLGANGFAYLAPQTHRSGNFPGRPDFVKKMAPVFSRMMLIRNKPCYLSDQDFGPGGNFVVTASQILRQSKDWLAAWDKLVQKERNPLGGHLVERTWACFWNPGYGKCKCKQ